MGMMAVVVVVMVEWWWSGGRKGLGGLGKFRVLGRGQQ